MKRISLLLLFFSISLPLDTKLVDSYNKDIAIEQFEQKYPNDWFYRWNNHGTPHRVIGSKIPFVFDTQNEKLSEEYARKFVEENQYFFGIQNSNLELWVNEFGNKIRYITFNQTHNGIPVHNARIDIRFNSVGNIVLFGHDGYPDINVSTNYHLNDQQALNIAKAEVQFSQQKGDYVFDEPKKFIWASKDKKPTYHASWLLELHVHIKEINTGKRPVNHWKIFVDAHTGEILEKFDLARDLVVEGRVTGDVKDEPYGDERNRGLQNVEVSIDGYGSTYTDSEGYYSIEAGEENVFATVRLEGNYLNANNQNGSDAQIRRIVTPGSTEDFNFTNNNSIPGERDTYYHANHIHDLLKSINPDISGADYEMPARVNIGSEDPYWPCNAYWDYTSINMFSEGGGCAGTDQMADVVYHEYGHGIMQFTYEPYDAPWSTELSEGTADFWAMTITNTPCLGLGFFGDGTCLRDGLNTRQYPGNECGGSVHCLGEITMGSLWKMRRNLINIMGYEQGVEHSNDLFHFGQVGRPNSAPDLLEEMLIIDDNDGDINNGTPFYAEICSAFEEHNIPCPISGPFAELAFTPESMNFEIFLEDSQSDLITLSNVGQQGSTMNYAIGVSPFSNAQGGPDSNGNFWSDSDNEETINYEWIDISDLGTLYNFPGNDQAGINLDIGFDFPFYGNTYSSFIINANGWIGFGEDSNAWNNLEIPSIDAPRPAIFGLWDDLNPVNDQCNDYCSGEVYYHSNSERLVVWFDNVAHWWTDYNDMYYSFQIVLYPNGEINMNYKEFLGDPNNESGLYSATVGIQDAEGLNALQILGDTGAGNQNDIHDQHGFVISQGPSWIELNPTSGQVLEGNSSTVEVTVNSYDINPDLYSSFIKISSNGGQGTIPVTLNVLASEPGDINADGNINVQDVVMIVSFILESDTPDAGQEYASDMNGDGILNVMDVILIVSLIIG
tara:strand:- start:691 stop:3546 length:2856 start_codon:yes stop_codon:yes gene_type:complete